jgi:hypothetical protein
VGKQKQKTTVYSGILKGKTIGDTTYTSRVFVRYGIRLCILLRELFRHFVYEITPLIKWYRRQLHYRQKNNKIYSVQK